jgi:Ion channel
LTINLRILIAKLKTDSKQNWIYQNDFDDISDGELYLTALYFTITTIVTVGYGEITAYSSIEKVVCILLMITGIYGFSFTTGAIASIIFQEDSSTAKL